MTLYLLDGGRFSKCCGAQGSRQFVDEICASNGITGMAIALSGGCCAQLIARCSWAMASARHE
jgi:hypothetical protein